MAEFEEVCYTREGAIQKAIEMEQHSFDVYRRAYEVVEDRRAKKLVKELALEELEHKYTLEKAFLEEEIALHEAHMEEGPSMKLTLLLEEKPLHEDSSAQDVMIHAIHEEKRSVDFYTKMAQACGDAPMAGMYQRLAQDEGKHLAQLEELYESIYMPEM
ncbi:MAG: ferritin family protein [Deltaproteobacteria bacterium]|nr:ferritin family protein [Deltaproteobacteria bacterium]MBW2070649.1 ferritin family protein [Deltaproteobacteria bacterium]